MKQILEDLRTGAIRVEDVPAPQLRPGCLLVRNHFSAISAGTEAATVLLGKKSLLGKALARPEQVQKVINVVRTQGLMTAYRAASRSLDMPIPLGYSTAGVVLEVGAGAEGLVPGDLVACSGAPYAYHAEVVCVPRNLCVKVPAGVDARHAAFGTVGAIALNALRVGEFALGERVVIVGLGLLGLLATQLARAAGCHVFGLDPNPRRREFFEAGGYGRAAPSDDDAARQVAAWSAGEGADLVIITASTSDNQPVTLAGHIARRRGRVVVVGRTEISAPRETYLFKELRLLTSFSCGPGADDLDYELASEDYPADLVRWSERRNVDAFLGQIAAGRVSLTKLVSHEFPVERAPEAFDLITGGGEALAVLLSYPESQGAAESPAAPAPVAPRAVTGGLRVGVIGAGSHATNEGVPLLARRSDLQLRGISSASGVRAAALARRYGFAYCVSGADKILDDGETDAVWVMTRHDTHAEFAARALRAGKHVLVEKPLALTGEQLELVIEAQRQSKGCLMVGFNRRYAPLALRLRERFAQRNQPMSITYRANVGYRPPQHWLHHPEQGGGVLLAEACHYIDFCCWLVGSPVVESDVAALRGQPPALIGADNLHISLRFEDGSLAAIQYLSNGDTTLPREQVEVFCERRCLALTDFKRLRAADGGASGWWPSLGSDWGHAGLLDAFIDCARGRSDPAPVSASMLHSSRIAIALDGMLRRRVQT